MDPLPQRWRSQSTAAAIALGVLIAAWQLLPVPTAGTALRTLILCVPLLAPLPGLWRAHRYTYQWATLCVMPYFVVGITETIADPTARFWAGGMLAVSLWWFVALIAFLRVTTRDRR